MTYLNDTNGKLLVRLARILEADSEHHKVKVAFGNSATEEPTWASIGRGFTKTEIHMAIDNQLTCKIEFVGDDLAKPILTDIYFSLLSEETLIIKADKITLEGTESLTLKSQQASTQYDARSGRITSKADYIASRAEKLQTLQAQKIDLN
ncbi:MAG: hypothetical protein HRU48_18160 [Vibrio sp.]|uniref:hypothetical protein n=1 Tax=Vibrio TaxID=662 RepID=UPI001ECA3D60|nr:hypothetical protein [Vibrio sp.]NRB69263.1 hypothetical protein [Vibrio sp.]